jgi:hypothetical protein
MSRSKRIATIIPALLLLIVVAPNWWSSARDHSPTPVVLFFLIAVFVLLYFNRFSAVELSALIMTTAPALYLIFHSLCGFPAAEAYLMVLRCALAPVLYFLLSSITDTGIPKPTAPILHLLAVALIPFLWAFVLMKQSALFPISLTILVGLLWIYRRSLESRG